VEELPPDVAGLEAALLRWNQVYETVRHHQALGYQTPERFYQETSSRVSKQLVGHSLSRKGGLVRYLLTQYRGLTKGQGLYSVYLDRVRAFFDRSRS